MSDDIETTVTAKLTFPIDIPGYTLKQVIGQGGMASVYLAIQDSLQRPVALKVLKNPEDEEFAQRFLNEGQMIAAIKHPNIITIYDIGIVEHYHYIAMEYIEGGSLEQRLKRGKMNLDQALDIIEKIADCLAVIHAKGIIHRDVKPANILFRYEDTPLLTDFGIAKQINTDQNLTSIGIIPGTPAYLSPEQAQQHFIDGRSDIYSLGIVLHKMLTGTVPYKGDSHIDTALKHIQDPLPVLPEPYGEAQTLLNKILAKKPSNRFDAVELVKYIRHLKDLRAKENDPATVQLKAYHPHDNSKLKYISVILLLAMGFGLFGVTLWYVNNHSLATSVTDTNSAQRDNTITKTTQTNKQTGIKTVDSEPNQQADEADIIQTQALQPVVEQKDTQLTEQLTQASTTDKMPSDLASDSQAQLQRLDKSDIETSPLESDSNQFINENETKNNHQDKVEEQTEPLHQPSLTSITDTDNTNTADRQIQQWLAQARQKIQQLQLAKPYRDSALYYYREVLKLDPNNQQALEGKHKIAETYYWLAMKNLKQHNYRKVKRFTYAGLRIQPEHENLLRLKKKVKYYQQHRNESVDISDLPESVYQSVKDIFK